MAFSGAEEPGRKSGQKSGQEIAKHLGLIWGLGPFERVLNGFKGVKGVLVSKVFAVF